MEKKSACLTLRCPPSLKNRIKSLAESSHRSTSQEVIYLIELGITQLEQGGGQHLVSSIKGKGDESELVYEDEGELAEW